MTAPVFTQAISRAALQPSTPLSVSATSAALFESFDTYEQGPFTMLDPVIASPEGGQPPYTVVWADIPNGSADSPSELSTTYTIQSIPQGFTSFSLACTVTDSSGVSASAVAIFSILNGFENGFIQ